VLVRCLTWLTGLGRPLIQDYLSNGSVVVPCHILIFGWIVYVHHLEIIRISFLLVC